MGSWFTRHLQTLVGTLGRLARQPLANSLTIVVIAIALALPALLGTLVINARAIGGGWGQTISLSVYLKHSTSLAQAEQLAQRLQQRREFAEVRLVRAEDALKEFRQSSAFGPALDALTENPLPHAIVLRPSTEGDVAPPIEKLKAELQGLPEVELVQLDTTWVKRLYAILDVIRRSIILAGLLLGVGIVVVIGNTIRLDIQNRRDEIEITKLVGGTNAFVRRPFLYSGVWYGFAGGLGAALLVALAVGALSEPVRQVAELYSSTYRLQQLGWGNSALLLAIGMVLGWTGSFVATTIHLRNIEPR